MLEAVSVLQASNARDRHIAGLQRTLVGSGRLVTGCMTTAVVVLTLVIGAPIALIGALLLLSVATGWLEKVSWLIAILPLPLGVLVGGVGAALLVRGAVRRLENRCVAIPPSKPGESAACHLCGAPLTTVGEQAVARCGYCQADNVVSATALQRARQRRDVVMQDYAQAIRRESFRIPAFSLVGTLGWGAAVLLTMFGSCKGAQLYDEHLETVTGPRGADALLRDAKISSFGVQGASLFVHEARGTLSVMPKAGGDKRLLCKALQSVATSKSMALDATHAYWVTSGGILVRCSHRGGEVEEVGPIPMVKHSGLRLAVDATHVYGTAPGVVYKAPKSGAEAVVLAEVQGNPDALGLDNDAVYWIDKGVKVNTPDHLRRVPKAGGDVLTLDSRESLSSDVTPVFDDAYVYVVANFGNSVDRIPKAGGRYERLARYEESDIEELAIDATHIYFATRYDSLGCSGSVYGSVRRVPKAGGTVDVLTGGLKQPRGIAVDATHVYWSDLYRDTLMRIPKQPRR